MECNEGADNVINVEDSLENDSEAGEAGFTEGYRLQEIMEK